MHYPHITIVTPSYNQAAYLEETIESVVAQGYPNLEYFIIDGGSTDGSVEIIKKHQHHLAGWESEKDHGQAHAINKGFARASPQSQLFAYLNSDDLYMPQALHKIASAWNELTVSACIPTAASPQAVFASQKPVVDQTWIVADVVNFGEGHPEKLFAYPEEKADFDRWMWFCANPVHQPGSFWAADLFRRFGPFNDVYRCCFDYDLFLRFRILGNVRPHHLPQTIARFRLHPASKTVVEPEKFDPEFDQVRKAITAQLAVGELRQLQRFVRHTQADRLQVHALESIRQGHRKRAMSEILHALWLEPGLLWQRRTAGCVKRLIRPAPSRPNPEDSSRDNARPSYVREMESRA